MSVEPGRQFFARGGVGRVDRKCAVPDAGAAAFRDRGPGVGQDPVPGLQAARDFRQGQAAQAETLRKMVVAMARDIRLLVIKLADRLHNMRTWRYVSQESA